MVEFPKKLIVGSWVKGSVIITTRVTKVPCILVPLLVIMCPFTGINSTSSGGRGNGPGEGGLGPVVGRGAPQTAKAVWPLNWTTRCEVEAALRGDVSAIMTTKRPAINS